MKNNAKGTQAFVSTSFSDVFRRSRSGICPKCRGHLVITDPYAYVDFNGNLHSQIGKKSCSDCGYSTYNMF